MDNGTLDHLFVGAYQPPSPSMRYVWAPEYVNRVLPEQGPVKIYSLSQSNDPWQSSIHENNAHTLQGPSFTELGGFQETEFYERSLGKYDEFAFGMMVSMAENVIDTARLMTQLNPLFAMNERVNSIILNGNTPSINDFKQQLFYSHQHTYDNLKAGLLSAGQEILDIRSRSYIINPRSKYSLLNNSVLVVPNAAIFAYEGSKQFVLNSANKMHNAWGKIDHDPLTAGIEFGNSMIDTVTTISGVYGLGYAAPSISRFVANNAPKYASQLKQSFNAFGNRARDIYALQPQVGTQLTWRQAATKYAQGKLPINAEKLTKGQIVEYLQNVDKIPLKQLTNDLNRLGFELLEYRPEKNVYKFSHVKNAIRGTGEAKANLKSSKYT